MKRVLIFSLIIFSILIFVSSKSVTQIIDDKPLNWFDSLHPPIIATIPTSFEVQKPKKGKFIIKELLVQNKGGSPLEIRSAKGSCYCASATVLKSPIDTSSTGKIMLYINLDGLYESNNIVEYTIESNASNSPTTVNVTILTSKTDTLSKPK